MSVLIKNIEMPKNCSDCLFESSPRGAHYCQIEMRAVESLEHPGWCPLEEAEPIKMMCNGAYINCPAHKDYERGYKDGQAEAQMKAEPTKHGRWIRKTEQLKDCTVYWYVCSECGERPLHGRLRADDALTNYCPNCGAIMDVPNNAHWIKQLNGEYKCSVCGDTTLAPLYECGTCGAIMDGVEE